MSQPGPYTLDLNQDGNNNFKKSHGSEPRACGTAGAAPGAQEGAAICLCTGWCSCNWHQLCSALVTNEQTHKYSSQLRSGSGASGRWLDAPALPPLRQLRSHQAGWEQGEEPEPRPSTAPAQHQYSPAQPSMRPGRARPGAARLRTRTAAREFCGPLGPAFPSFHSCAQGRLSRDAPFHLCCFYSVSV